MNNKTVLTTIFAFPEVETFKARGNKYDEAYDEYRKGMLSSIIHICKL